MCISWQVDGKVYVAGQIPLVPGSMTLVTGGIRMQSCLSLQHVSSILDAMCPGTTVLNVLLAVCYVVHHDFIAAAKQQWQLVCTMKVGKHIHYLDVYHLILANMFLLSEYLPSHVHLFLSTSIWMSDYSTSCYCFNEVGNWAYFFSLPQTLVGKMILCTGWVAKS